MPHSVTSHDLVHADRTIGLLHVTDGLCANLIQHVSGDIVGVCHDPRELILLHRQLEQVSVDAPLAVTVLGFNDRFEGGSKELGGVLGVEKLDIEVHGIADKVVGRRQTQLLFQTFAVLPLVYTEADALRRHGLVYVFVGIFVIHGFSSFLVEI